MLFKYGGSVFFGFGFASFVGFVNFVSFVGAEFLKCGYLEFVLYLKLSKWIYFYIFNFLGKRCSGFMGRWG